MIDGLLLFWSTLVWSKVLPGYSITIRPFKNLKSMCLYMKQVLVIKCCRFFDSLSLIVNYLCQICLSFPILSKVWTAWHLKLLVIVYYCFGLPLSSFSWDFFQLSTRLLNSSCGSFLRWLQSRLSLSCFLHTFCVGWSIVL